MAGKNPSLCPRETEKTRAKKRSLGKTDGLAPPRRTTERQKRAIETQVGRLDTWEMKRQSKQLQPTERYQLGPGLLQQQTKSTSARGSNKASRLDWYPGVTDPRKRVPQFLHDVSEHGQ